MNSKRVMETIMICEGVKLQMLFDWDKMELAAATGSVDSVFRSAINYAGEDWVCWVAKLQSHIFTKNDKKSTHKLETVR